MKGPSVIDFYQKTRKIKVRRICNHSNNKSRVLFLYILFNYDLEKHLTFIIFAILFLYILFNYDLGKHMKYFEFRNKVKQYPLFHSNMLEHLTPKPQMLRNQLVNWVKKGYVICLKRGVYTLNNDDRDVKFSLFFLASNLCTPSYISLESALEYYHMIPERVVQITSITTKKTQQYQNTFGFFTYHHLKTSLFDYFMAKKDEYGNNFFIAYPEKALVDFLYFRTRGNKQIEEDIFDISFRLQNLEGLDKSKIAHITADFRNNRLNRVVDLFIKYWEKNYA